MDVCEDDLPFHIQQGVQKGRSIEDGNYALCIIIAIKLQQKSICMRKL